MPIEKWSDSIVVVHMADDPQFTDDMTALQQPGAHTTHTVLDFATVRTINSSNIAQLLKLRKQAINADVRLILCSVADHTWGTFLVTGLDKVFEFSENVTTALATLQMTRQRN